MKLRIEKAIYGGAGLARLPETPRAGDQASREGKAVFVPNALPGELIEARLTDNRRGFSTAELVSVLEPSIERVAPGCEYFPACGGCQYQHASAAYQLRMKLDILKETLERARLKPYLDSLQTIAGLGGPEWGYRNRIRLHLAESDGVLQLCYRERGSHSNLPVAHCPIAAPLIERAIAAVLRAGQTIGLSRLCQEIEFFVNGEQDSLLVSLWRTGCSSHGRTHPESTQSAQSLERGLRDFCEQLRGQVPELTGAGVFFEHEGSSRLLHHWGQPFLLYTVSGRVYRVSLGSFFQVNRFLIPELLRVALSYGPRGNRRGRLAWDLYAGVGLFTRALDFERIAAVESSPSSAADLRQNLAGTPYRAVQSSTLDFLREQSRSNPQAAPDLILLDSPRAGLGKDVCAHLSRIAAPAIVYVSCDPATLARDLQALLQSGYRLQSMHMLDLFPQTFHLETVAVLERTQDA